MATNAVVSSGAHDPRGAAAEEERPRTSRTSSTVPLPGSVNINLKGAFVVDYDAQTPGVSPTRGGHHETKDIRLPNHNGVVSHVAVDIGGSLIKIVYFTREPTSTDPGGRLNFINFETDRIDLCIDFMKKLKEKQQTLNGSQPGELLVMATGGGAFKYYDTIKDALGVEVLREDEMECLIIGLDFFITEIPSEVFSYSEQDPMHFITPTNDIYPYLLVNIGSGVSLIKVSSPTDYTRIGGTSLGGGTLWGLLSLLTGAKSFDEMLRKAERGDNKAVDMLVGDIYGTDYGKIGLDSSIIASSFGKVFRLKKEAEEKEEPETDSDAVGKGTDFNKRMQSFREEDISLSLLYTVSNNIGQIAYLTAELHGLENIYFGGSFIRGHSQTISSLAFAIKFWSQGKKKPFFLRHEGYLGACGAFLKRQPRNWGRRNSTDEGPNVQKWASRKEDGEESK